MQLEPIGYIRSPYLTKFGVPRQPGLAPSVQSHLEFKPGYCMSDAVLGLHVGDWIHILWCFSHNTARKVSWAKTVRPPILGGTKRQGVFATRSSFRPNDLALSCAKITSINDDRLSIMGGDMVDGTPFYDVYPYDSKLDSFAYAHGGWSGDEEWLMLKEVLVSDVNMSLVAEHLRAGLIEVLIQDPRPAYTRQGQEDRVFWTAFDRYVVHFTVNDGIMNVLRIEEMNEDERNYLIETGSLRR